MVSYLTSIATMALSHTVSEIHQLTGQKLPNFLTLPLYSAPVRGETVGVKQRPLVTKN